MNKFCLVAVSLRAGGTERIVTRIAHHLSEDHAVTLILLSESEPFYALRPEIRVMRPAMAPRSQAGWRWYPGILDHLRRGLREARPDLVLCFGEPIAPVVLPVARIAGYRTVVFNRASPMASLRGVRGLLNPLTYPLADRVVVQTARAIALMRRRYRFSNFAVLPNPIDIPLLVPPVSKRARRILSVGTLGGSKNQQALIRAFANIEERREWRLDLVGDGPERTNLELLADELGIRSSVTFHGQRSDVDTLLQDSRIFAFSSLTEGFPNALAEALAAGCACISYDCPTGPSELIEDGVNGLLVANGEQIAFETALKRLVSDQGFQSHLAQNARERIRRFAAEAVFTQLDHLLEGALVRSGRRERCGCDS